MAEAQVVERQRREVSKRSFKTASGDYTARATTDSVGGRLEFIENGHVIEFNLKDFDQKLLNAAALWGIMTTLGNTFGGIKGPVEDAIEAAEERLSVFQDGDWNAERQSGPRTSHIVTAIRNLRAAAGQETTDEWIANWFKKLEAADKTPSDVLKSDKALDAEVARLKAQAQAARADKKAAEAADTASSILD
jgi:hypothetical protein